jgi:uncharacterized protein (TIGR00299 family) protein
MNVGHWDARFGLSGDMALGALVDAGARLEAVNAALAALGIPGLRAEVGRAVRCGVDCARVRIRWEGDGPERDAGGEPGGASGHGHHPPHHAHPHGPGAGGHGQAHVHRAYRDIRELLRRAALAPGVRERAEAIFARLAEAEGRVHGRPVADVHFHEVGGEDAIGDVVGVAAALEDLQVGQLTVSPLPAGGGLVRAAHGLLPVPAPAVALLLEGFHWEPGPVEAELVTPTGAAILAALARPAASWPALRLRGSGWGAGSRDFPGHPNACRFVWGEPAGPAGPAGLVQEVLVELETNLDDLTPEGVGYLFERLFAAGALDVAASPLFMKKQRPGVAVWALVRPADVDAAVRCLLAESTALGLRLREVRRWSLPRASETVQTPFGPVRVKVARLDGRVVNAAPEYEDCRAAALAHGVPLKAVLAAAVAAWQARAQG